MSAPKHTAGPWQTRDDYTADGALTIIGNVDGEYDAEGVAQCTYDTIAICQDEFGEALPNAGANARLIAAAPDLLEALLLILPLAKGYRPEGQTDTARRTCNSWIEAAEEVVAKAIGEGAS